jgi:hypothetical protein
MRKENDSIKRRLNAEIQDLKRQIASRQAVDDQAILRKKSKLRLAQPEPSIEISMTKEQSVQPRSEPVIVEGKTSDSSLDRPSQSTQQKRGDSKRRHEKENRKRGVTVPPLNLANAKKLY